MAKKKYRVRVMGNTSTFDIEKLTDGLDTIARRVKNPKPVMNKIGREMAARVRRNFESQTRPDGSRWEKLKPETRSRRKVNTSANSKMLRDTGALKKSLKGFEAKKDKHGKWSVAVSTSVPYAKTQNYSTLGHLRKPRTFMALTKQDRPRYVEMLRDYLTKGVKLKKRK